MRIVFICMVCLFITVCGFAQNEHYFSKQYVDTITIDFNNPQEGQFLRTYPRNFIEAGVGKGGKIADSYFDTLAQLFYLLPQCTFEIGAYTDTPGPANKNFNQSVQRAISFAAYLSRFCNIPRSAIIPKGYGETVPLNHCTEGVICTEEEHLINRRIEIKIIAVAAE